MDDRKRIIIAKRDKKRIIIAIRDKKPKKGNHEGCPYIKFLLILIFGGHIDPGVNPDFAILHS
jgi:hypothetical protein